jgi:hypothetical protein
MRIHTHDNKAVLSLLLTSSLIFHCRAPIPGDQDGQQHCIQGCVFWSEGLGWCQQQVRPFNDGEPFLTFRWHGLSYNSWQSSTIGLQCDSQLHSAFKVTVVGVLFGSTPLG